MNKKKEGNNQKGKSKENIRKMKNKSKLPPVSTYQAVREQAE